jgi:hypothetical protein
MILTAIRKGVDPPEEVVRSTLDPVTDDAPPEAPDEPDHNEPEFDIAQRNGLARRNVGPHITDARKDRSIAVDPATAEAMNAVIINGQVSSSGRAAALENAGVFGHGTMPIVEGIEPGIPAVQFGGDYFTAVPRKANQTGGDYMEPQIQDDLTAGGAQAFAIARSRMAFQPDSLAGWLNHGD